MASPLGNPSYRRLFAAQVIALSGTGLTTVALALLAFELAGDRAGAVLGTALTIKMVTYVGIAPVVGSLADRLPRKGLLIALDLARAGIVLSLPFVSEVWHVYALIFLLNGCSAGFTPTFQAAIPDILRDEAQYTRALSLSRLAHDLENLLSPTLAAAALAFISFDTLFVANGAAFAVSALLIVSLALPKAKADERSDGAWDNLSYGVRSYLATPRLRGVLALSLSRLAHDLENLLSPALAAAALAFISFDTLFVANGAAFAVSALLIVSVALPKAKAGERSGGAWDNLSYGVRSYLATPRLRGLLSLSLAVAAAGAMVIVNTVVYVRAELGLSASVTAIALAAFGGGSMVVALLLPRVLERVRDRTIMLSGGAVLAFALVFGVTRPPLAGLLVLWFVIGVGTSLIQTPAGRLVVRSCREGDRPAFYAAQFALSHAAWLVAYALAGWLGAGQGLTVTFVVLAAVVAGATLVAARVWPAADASELDHDHAATEHNHLHTHDAHHQHEHECREGPEPHRHGHRHPLLKHRHAFVIDLHHRRWPA